LFPLNEYTEENEDPQVAFIKPFSRITGYAFFLTTSGRMGIAFGSIQKGDQIALISGLGKPFILRPWGRTWKLVGHGYVDGLMGGEKWSDVNPNTSHIDLV
jgi:hypothetical protein